MSDDLSSADSPNASRQRLILAEARLANQKKSITAAFLLWFFLGALGGHNFYLNHVIQGTLKLLLLAFSWLVIPGILLFGWWVIDAFLIPSWIEKDTETKRQKILESLPADV